MYILLMIFFYAHNSMNYWKSFRQICFILEGESFRAGDFCYVFMMQIFESKGISLNPGGLIQRLKSLGSTLDVDLTLLPPSGGNDMLGGWLGKTKSDLVRKVGGSERDSLGAIIQMLV